MIESELLSLLEQVEKEVNLAKSTKDYSKADAIKAKIKAAGVHIYDTKDASGNKSTQYHIKGNKFFPEGIHGTYVWKHTAK